MLSDADCLQKALFLAPKLASLSICGWPQIDLFDDELSELSSEHEVDEEEIDPFRYERAVKEWVTQVFGHFLKKWQTHTLKAIRLGGHESLTYVDCLEDLIEPEFYTSQVNVSCNGLKTLKVQTTSIGGVRCAVDDTELLELEIDRLWW